MDGAASQSAIRSGPICKGLERRECVRESPLPLFLFVSPNWLSDDDPVTQIKAADLGHPRRVAPRRVQRHLDIFIVYLKTYLYLPIPAGLKREAG